MTKRFKNRRTIIWRTIVFIFCAASLLLIASCATSNKSQDSKEFKKAKTVVTYSGMKNELGDGYMIFKANNYFMYYGKQWAVVNIKQNEVIGRYTQTNDTIYLNWLGADPKKIYRNLSNKCVIDTTAKQLWFLDEAINKRVWGLNLSRND